MKVTIENFIVRVFSPNLLIQKDDIKNLSKFGYYLLYLM